MFFFSPASFARFNHMHHAEGVYVPAGRLETGLAPSRCHGLDGWLPLRRTPDRQRGDAMKKVVATNKNFLSREKKKIQDGQDDGRSPTRARFTKEEIERKESREWERFTGRQKSFDGLFHAVWPLHIFTVRINVSHSKKYIFKISKLAAAAVAVTAFLQMVLPRYFHCPYLCAQLISLGPGGCGTSRTEVNGSFAVTRWTAHTKASVLTTTTITTGDFHNFFVQKIVRAWYLYIYIRIRFSLKIQSGAIRCVKGQRPWPAKIRRLGNDLNWMEAGGSTSMGVSSVKIYFISSIFSP